MEEGWRGGESCSDEIEIGVPLIFVYVRESRWLGLDKFRQINLFLGSDIYLLASSARQV